MAVVGLMLGIRYVYFLLDRRFLGDFEDYLLSRVGDPKSRDFRHPTITNYLFFTSLKSKEHIRACLIYRDFEDLVKPHMNDDLERRLNESLDAISKMNSDSVKLEKIRE